VATILIVDDSSFARATIRRALEPGKHTLAEASSGFEALEYVQSNSPDVVTIDLLMPDMTGVELVEHLRKISPTSLLVVITADVQNATRELLLEAGADSFINKPTDSRLILDEIDRLLANQSRA
jgi:two-component system, chemotaxis family, chemotaxis protein CheY